jgi:hypothetical protein
MDVVVPIEVLELVAVRSTEEFLRTALLLDDILTFHLFFLRFLGFLMRSYRLHSYKCLSGVTPDFGDGPDFALLSFLSRGILSLHTLRTFVISFTSAGALLFQCSQQPQRECLTIGETKTPFFLREAEPVGLWVESVNWASDVAIDFRLNFLFFCSAEHAEVELKE